MSFPNQLPSELIRLLDDIKTKGFAVKPYFEIETGFRQQYKVKYFTINRTVEAFLN